MNVGPREAFVERHIGHIIKDDRVETVNPIILTNAFQCCSRIEFEITQGALAL